MCIINRGGSASAKNQNIQKSYQFMKKHRKMSEKTCFIAACTFAAASVLTAVLLICLYFLIPASAQQGMGGVITSYAISAAKLAILCFLSGATLFLSLFALVFSVKTVIDNEGMVRLYGIMLSALTASSAAFGGCAFVFILKFFANFKF